MTAFDIGVFLVIGLSTLFAFLRGFIRELVALASWIIGIVAALAFTPWLGEQLPDVFGHPVLRYLVAFGLIIVAALLLGALVAWPLARVVRAAGLGFADRFLGSIFGLLRGAALVLAFVLVAGLTGLPRSPWWQDSLLAAPLAAAALGVATHLPPAWANALDYSRGAPARRAVQST
jgi:membrane protein required for colicin V production